MKVKTIVHIRNFGIALIFFGAVLSLVSGIFVAKSVALSILLWPLFIGSFTIMIVPFLSRSCPNCEKSFFGKWYAKDILTSRCKACGYEV